jgi:hypothetical protein
MMVKRLKLFVWQDVLVDWTSGIIFALAENENQAREMVVANYSGTTEIVCREMGKPPEVYDEPVGFALWGGG